jgi:hypothetical protein
MACRRWWKAKSRRYGHADKENSNGLNLKIRGSGKTPVRQKKGISRTCPENALS